MLAVDHILIAVPDLDRAADALAEGHALESLPGGRHPGVGTANRIVPLGESYLELIAVVDPEAAARAPLGRWVGAAADGAPAAGRLLGLCLRTAAMADHARRLGLLREPGSRERPDGVVLRWSLAGLDRAMGPERLPFLIEWEDASRHPGRLAADGRAAGPGALTVGVGGDSERLAEWLDGEVPGVVAVGGEPGLRWAEVSRPDGAVRFPGR